MVAARRDDGLVRAAVADHAELRLATGRLRLTRFLLGAGDDERIGLQCPQLDLFATGCEVAIRAVVGGLAPVSGGPEEAPPLELAIDHDRDPPAGDRVLAQFEEAACHSWSP